MARSTLEDKTQAIEPADRRIFHARRIATLATIAAALLALVIVGVVSSGSRAALAQVRVRSGSVRIEHGTKGFTKATDGTDVTAGDQVKTSSDGQGVIDYFDGSVTRLDTNTHVTIRELSQRQTGDRIGVTLNAGRLWDHVRDATSASDRFAIRLSNVTMSSAGSTFLTDCRRSDACFVVDFDGTTHVASSNGEETDLNAGDCESISPDGSLDSCDANKLHLIDAWVRSNLAEDQELVAPSVTTAPSASPAPTVGSDTSTGFVPRHVSGRPPVRTPSHTPPPSTSTPVPTKKPLRTFPPTPTPHHRPRPSSTP